MVGFSKFDSERYLLEVLDRIARNRSEYKALYVNVSKLKPKNRHPKFAKIISRLFDDFVSIANGSIFILSDGDFVVLGKNITDKLIDDTVDKLRRGLITDPIWTSHSSTEFTELYMPDDFDLLAQRIEALMKADAPLDLLSYRYPVDAGQIDAVKEQLDEINIVDLVKHQSVLKLEGANKFRLLFEEFFVAVKDLSSRFDENIDLTGNKWLFLYLTQTLDKKTMYSFLFSDIKNMPEKISLNLNLSTLFLPEFDNFLKQLEEKGKILIAEVQVMDILNNLATYFDAKELLRRRGHQILIDAASIEMMQALNIARLEADYIKIFWHALMEEYTKETDDIQQMIASVGAEKFILAKCLDDKALRWGIRHGIYSFQGPYIDILQSALIRAKCPNGKVCTPTECMKRRKQIAGSFRNECQYKDFLEKEPV